MTVKELKENGWSPIPCKVGTLFFNGKFFCRMNGEKAIVYYTSNDDKPVGVAENFDELMEIQRQSELSYIMELEEKVRKLKESYEKRYGVIQEILN